MEAMLAVTRGMGWPQQASPLQGESIFSHCAFNLKSHSTPALDFWSSPSGNPRCPVSERRGRLCAWWEGVLSPETWLAMGFPAGSPSAPGAG